MNLSEWLVSSRGIEWSENGKFETLRDCEAPARLKFETAT